MADKSTNTFDTIEALLGKADYAAPGIRLYQRDCVKAMQLIPSNSVDLTVTSPPYNIGKEYESSLDLDAYLNWCKSWIDEIHRTTAYNGAFWLNLGYVAKQGRGKAIPIPYLLWDRISFFLMQEIVWHYGAGVASRHSFSPRNEKFLWFVKDESNYTFNLDDVRDTNVKYPNQKKNGKLKCNPNGKNPTDVWEFPKVTSGADRSSPERTSHPAQFPVSIIERIIKSSSNVGDTVLDPFMGSGTTALVAVQLGRPVVGFEVSDKYMEIASRRLDSFFEEERINDLQQVLFDGVNA